MSNLLKLSAVATLAFALHGSLANASTEGQVQAACAKGDAQACQQLKTPVQAERGWFGHGRWGWGHRWHGGGGFCYWHPYAPACRW